MIELYVQHIRPEEWVDITDSFIVEQSQFVAKAPLEKCFVELFGQNLHGYRLRKITLGTCAAFIIEKMQP